MGTLSRLRGEWLRVLLGMVGALLLSALPSQAATTLSITPITWGVVGLDSNKVNDGPNLFLVGARVTNTGSEQATGVVATLAWDSSNPYIELQNPTLSSSNPLLVQRNYGVLDPTVPADVAQSVLDPGDSFDFYFNVQIQRTPSAHFTSRRFHITASASNASSVSTPTPREIYVEKLVSQNRNRNIQITGPSSVWVGGIFEFTMTGETATNGYEQIDMHIVFPNTVFQVISSDTTYSVGGPSDSVYEDACGWDPDPTSPNYNSCSGTGKAGGVLTQHYYAKIIDLPSGGSSITLNGTIYDYSGSSFHYNSNFNSNPNTLTLTVSPSPTRVDLGGADAIRHGSRVSLRWDTAQEAHNLGFHIWREVNGQKTRITVAPVAGSAFLAGPGVPSSPGGYVWVDRDVPLDAHPSYWIQALDLDGSTRMFGPFQPHPESNDVIPRRRSATLDDLSRVTGASSAALPAERMIGARLPSVISAARAGSGHGFRSADLASMNALKLIVREDGWYRIPGSSLIAAGLPSGTRTRGLRLIAGGEEVPVKVDDGGDGRMDAADTLEFYGLAIDTPWTDGQVYWLIDGSKPGARISDLSTRKATPLSASSFPFTVERKDRVLFFAALGGEDSDSFFGPMISTVYGPATQNLDVRHLDSDGTTASLTVRLQGVSDSLSTQDDHRVGVELNGISVGEMSFGGRQNVARSFEFPAGLLHEGTNVVRLTALQPVRDTVNWYVDSLVDRVTLTYPHTFDADDGWLSLSAPGGSSVTVGGFESSDVTAIDVTDPANPVALAPSVRRDGAGWDVDLVTPDGGARLVVVTSSDAALTPAAIVANQPSAWSDRKNGAELVILTSRALMDQAERLASRRREEGWEVATIDVQDLYDEYNFGVKSPWAIRNFLEQAGNDWRPGPGYVLLLGDASVDPRGYLGYPDRDLVPTHMVMTAYAQAASDEWFVDFDGDGVGEMAIGRLPAGTPDEAAILVDKTLQYESEPAGTWNRKVDIMAGPRDAPGINDFVDAGDHLATHIPVGFDLKKSYVDQDGAAKARADLLSRWSDGSGVVAYYGHGYASGWGLGTNLFTASDAARLTNEGRLPVVEAMTCLSGWFFNPSPGVTSLAEALLRNPHGGAVAVWASSGSTNLESQVPASEEFFDALVHEGATLGEAARRGKKAAFDADIRHSWILFGDPTLVLPEWR